MEQQDYVPNPPEPPRLPFYEQVQMTFQSMVEALCRDVPEFRGAAIAIVWDLNLPATDLMHGMILGKDVEQPQFILRASEQTNKLMRNLVASFMQQLQVGNEAAKELDAAIALKRKELNDLQEKIQQASPR